MTFEHEFTLGLLNPLTLSFPVVIAVGIFLGYLGLRRVNGILFGLGFAATVASFILGGGGQQMAISQERDSFFDKIESTYGVKLELSSYKNFFNKNAFSSSLTPTEETPFPVLLTVDDKSYSTTVILREVDDNEWLVLSPKAELAEVIPLDEAVEAGLAPVTPLNE